MENEQKALPTETTDQINQTSPLYIKRVGQKQFSAEKDGAPAIPIGHEPGQYTPGDLLLIAVASCHASSSDARFSAALGKEFQQLIAVSGDYNKTKDRYDAVHTEMIQDLSALSDQEAQKLDARVNAAIDNLCTVKHTLELRPALTHRLTSENVSEN